MVLIRLVLSRIYLDEGHVTYDYSKTFKILAEAIVEHAVVVVSRIRVSWYLKVTYRWDRSVRYCFDHTPALPQFHLHLDGVLGDILIDTTGDDDFIFRHADMAAAALQEWGSPDVNIQESAGCTAFV